MSAKTVRAFLPMPLLVTIVMMATLGAACGDGDNDAACAGKTQSADGSVMPWVSRFRLASQLPGDPWTLVFGISFTDGDGDLGDTGAAEFFVNGYSTTTVDLGQVFALSGVETDARAGEIAVPLRFPDDTSDGSRVRIAVQLLDAAQRRSNCYSLDMNFSVSPTQ